jgi:hypothetical protein
MTSIPVASGGNRGVRRAALRWILLAWTLLGMAAMHTIGHIGAGHSMAMPEPPAAQRVQTTAMMLAEHAVHVSAPASKPCPSGCAHARDGGQTGGGHPDSWSVCLAILAAFAAAVLSGWLLRATTGGGANRPMRPLAITPRAPPAGGVGLRLAGLSVLRR